MSLAKLLPCVLLATGAVAQDHCIDCHRREDPKLMERHALGVHAGASVSCVGCHGGDASAPSAEAAHSAEHAFRGKMSRADRSALCVNCHSDAERMAPFGLDAEVTAMWRASMHGADSGLHGGAVVACVECHDVHGTLTSADPDSPTHRTRVPESCGGCHSDADKMSAFGRSTTPVSSYFAGVHGAIFVGGRPGARNEVPTCVDCHGAHRATHPRTEEVVELCGSCHVEERAELVRGPHFEALGYTGRPNCLDCHGEHRTRDLTGTALETLCSSCHEDQNGPILASARTMRLLLNRVQSAKRILDAAVRADSQRMRGDHRLSPVLYEGLEGHQARIRRSSHALDVEALEASVVGYERRVTAAVSVVTADLDAHPGFSDFVIGLIVGGLVVAFAGVSWLVTASLLRFLRKVGPNGSGVEAQG